MNLELVLLLIILANLLLLDVVLFLVWMKFRAVQQAIAPMIGTIKGALESFGKTVNYSNVRNVNKAISSKSTLKDDKDQLDEKDFDNIV